jgi:diguanylate cyclase (GGDEF)-like protein
MPDKQQPKKILIVDDDKEARDTIGDYLSEDGFSVEATDAGIKALEILGRSSFDLVISDLRMPKMDGIALTKKIKAMGPDAPTIIVITGFGTIQNAVESMKAGAFDFITKPFNLDQIKITIEKALETKRLEKLAREREFYKKLSNSDELTKLANYRHFSETLQKEAARAKRYNRPLSLMAIDIDDFKSCNDTYGHPAGNMVLQQIASLIKKNTRGCDLVARCGGEEFSVVLPETSEEEAYVSAERIRDEIDKFKFKTEENKPIGNLSVTIGLSSIPKDASNKKELIKTADTALYKGKASGKNRVVVYSETKA